MTKRNQKESSLLLAKKHLEKDKILQRAMVIVSVALFLLVIPVFLFEQIGYGYHLGRVSGESMLPTLKDGQMIIEYRFPWTTFEKGDIVTGYSPDGNNVIKRIVGLPGETISYVDGKLLVNGEECEYYPDYIFNAKGDAWSGTIPDGKYYVLGDNRGLSWDSEKREPYRLEAKVLFFGE